MAIHRGRMRARVASVAAPTTLFERMRAELHRRRRQPLPTRAGRHLAVVGACACIACDDDPARRRCAWRAHPRCSACA
jgi:hypothetical protein